MLTLDECRRLLGEAGNGMSDEAVLALREQLYVLADVITDMFTEQHKKARRSDKQERLKDWN